MRQRLQLVDLRRSLVGSLVVASVATMAIAGLAVAQFKIESRDVVVDRQRLMKLNGASLQDLNAKLKAGNIEAAVVNAETIAINAQHIPSLFPKGSLTGSPRRSPTSGRSGRSSRPRPRTYRRKQRSSGTPRGGRRNDTQATEAAAKDFFRLNCNRCQTPFRVPPGL